jgi:hypothetical protein
MTVLSMFAISSVPKQNTVAAEGMPGCLIMPKIDPPGKLFYVVVNLYDVALTSPRFRN